MSLVYFVYFQMQKIMICHLAFINCFHVLHQGSYHTCWKQVRSSLWELDGNHSSHHEPVL